MPRGSNTKPGAQGFQRKIDKPQPPTPAQSFVKPPRWAPQESFTFGENWKPAIFLPTLSRYAEHLEVSPRPAGHPLHSASYTGVVARFALTKETNLEEIVYLLQRSGYRTITVLGNHEGVDAPDDWKVVKEHDGERFVVSPAYPSSPMSVRALRDVEKTLRKGLLNRRRVQHITLEAH